MEGFFMDRIFGPTTTSSKTKFMEQSNIWVITKNSSTTFRMKAWSSGENVSFTSFFDIMAVNKTFHPPKYPLDRERFPAELPVALIYPQPGLQTALISRTWPRNKPSMSDWILLGCCLLVGPTNKNIFPKLVLCLKNMVIYYGTMRKNSPIERNPNRPLLNTEANLLIVSSFRMEDGHPLLTQAPARYSFHTPIRWITMPEFFVSLKVASDRNFKHNTCR